MSSRSLPLDPELAASRWQVIEDVLDEVAAAAKSPLAPADFYCLLLAKVVPAMGVGGGAVWTLRDPGELRLEYQLNLLGPKLAASHELLAAHQTTVEDALRTREPRIVPPLPHDSGRGHPSDCWLILHPFQFDAATPGVIELVAHRDTAGTACRELAGILAAVVELVEDFHRHGELAELRARAAERRSFDEFALRVHHSLDADETTFAIANDGRRLVGCDRASVLVRRGSKLRAAATSGVDSLARGAKVVRRLEQLALRVAAAGEPLWYYEGAPPIADEIQRPLDAYLDESHARMLAVVPLVEPRGEDENRPPRMIGVLVAESFEASQPADRLRQRLAAVVPHAALALHNALVHSRMPLAPLSRLLAKARWLVAARQLPKTALVAAAVAAVVAALALVPADFDVEAPGQFQPQVRRDVFASDDAVVSQLLVDHGSTVRAGQPLVILRKPELDLELRRVAGEMQTAEKRLAAVQAERLANARDRDDARRPHELAAEEESLKEQLQGLAEQRKILQQQQHDLTIASPIEGQVLSWDIRPLLEARPVERGQVLLTVGDLSGPWELELDVPDDRAGFVLGAREELNPDLDVSFVLPSDPGKVHRGQLVDVALTTELDEKSEPTVLATVQFDKQDVEALRPGATATARIHCGRRSLGYVWLHDLYHFVQSLWW